MTERLLLVKYVLPDRYKYDEYIRTKRSLSLIGKLLMMRLLREYNIPNRAALMSRNNIEVVPHEQKDTGHIHAQIDGYMYLTILIEPLEIEDV